MSTRTGAAGAWRPGSAPELLGLAGLGAAGAAVAYQAALGGEGLPLPCPLRTFTGVPCPLCGMTTAATGLASGDLGAALAANPFVFVLAGFTLAMVVLMAARAIGRAPGGGSMARGPSPTKLLAGRGAGRRELGVPAPPVRLGVDRLARPGGLRDTTGGRP